MTSPDARHVPVLPQEVLEWLNPQPGETFVDATTGAGGHSELILERLGTTGKLICLDRDPEMLSIARDRLNSENATYVEASFDQLRQVLDDLSVTGVNGILADLGICSAQLDDADRGFSFQQEGPLDMRMNPSVGESAADLVAKLSEKELADIFFQFGEERHSRRIAKKIVEQRKVAPMTTTKELADLIRASVPRAKGTAKKTIDPATRVFQALRIAVNDELSALEGLLAQLPHCLLSTGRAAIISFHSLEDRRVKNAFREEDIWEALTRKAVQASEDEIQANPRSRSARLRVARRVKA